MESCFYHQSHSQLGVVLLWLHPFILSGVISPLISSSILGTYWPGEFILQCPNFLPFHTVHGIVKERILKWFVIPFPNGPHSVTPLHYDLSVLGGPIRHGLVLPSHTKLWSMWSDWLLVCNCSFSLSASWSLLSVSTIFPGFLLPWTRGKRPVSCQPNPTMWSQSANRRMIQHGPTWVPHPSFWNTNNSCFD